jgi:hypothetical protein
MTAGFAHELEEGDRKARYARGEAAKLSTKDIHEAANSFHQTFPHIKQMYF